jgi:hypothetical protein
MFHSIYIQMQQHNNNKPGQDAFPPANIGNASNPAPNEEAGAPEGNQLIDKKGEKYLREVAAPEDYPDEQDWEEANKMIEKEKGEGPSAGQ